MTPDLQHGIRRLQLITQAKDNGDTHRLAAQVQRELMAAKRAG